MRESEDVWELLEQYCPWWTDKKWYRNDPQISYFESSVLKREPRLYHHLKQGILTKNVYGIITIRGPRRAGKTTIIKLLIRYLIKNNIDPRSIFYISLDYQGLKNVLLVDLLNNISKTSDDEKFVFLDEASMYPEWAQALKNLTDNNLIEKGKMKIIVTGSHSMDLADAASKLRDRQGRFAQQFNVGGNLIHVPLRFSEVVEAIQKDISSLFDKYKLRTSSMRFEILSELSKGRIPPLMKEIYDNYSKLLQSLFEDYLIHGGYPKAINEYIQSDKKSIPANFYGDLAELFIQDAKIAGLDPENLKRVLQIITNPKKLSSRINFEEFGVIGIDEEMRPKAKFKLKEYIEYLETTWSFFFSYRESKDQKCIPNYQENVKNYVLDPFLYHALYSYLHNISDPFSQSKSLLDDKAFKGHLVESVIASHLLLSQQFFARVPSVDYKNVLMYGVSSHNGLEQETDFVVCINKYGKNHRFDIESKYRKDPYIVSSEKRKIVLTEESLKEKDNEVYLPVSIFLLIF